MIVLFTSLHFLSTCYMTGVIWFVQLVHYPLFADIGDEEFKSYETTHQLRTTFVVLPGMLIEAGTCIFLLLAPEAFQTSADYYLFSLSAALLLIIWLSTFLVQVPLHSKLESGKDLQHIKRLVRSNWIRTIAWSLRATILTALSCKIF